MKFLKYFSAEGKDLDPLCKAKIKALLRTLLLMLQKIGPFIAKNNILLHGQTIGESTMKKSGDKLNSSI